MLRYIKYLVLAAIAVALVTVALANRESIELRLLPTDLAVLTGVELTMSLPLFVIILASVLVGVALGFVWEWVREHKHRAEAAARSREVERLAREVERARGSGPPENPVDEVIALVDGPVRKAG